MPSSPYDTLRAMRMKLLPVAIAVLIVLVGLTAGGVFLWNRTLAAAGPLMVETHVIISSGDTPRVMAHKLAGVGVIGDERVFLAAVRLMRLGPSLKAGEYVFEPGISLRGALGKLAAGDVEQRSVTIPEGFTVRQVLERLKATDGLAGVPVAADEGMLFPDTYAFHFGSDVKGLMAEMQKRMRAELDRVWAARDTSLPLNSPEELLILASIVQKEAASAEEMPMIAGVFVNRLRKGMRLQSDPTVMYGAELVGNDIRTKDLREEQPFNTYVYAGLPPTPIANPGLAALAAAARPAATDALFFVADPSRTMHVFSRTYEEHKRHVKNYWTSVEREAKNTLRTRGAAVTSATVTPTKR